MKSYLPEGVAVRNARRNDISEIARIHKDVFCGNKDNQESAISWIRAHFAAFPAYHYYVIKKNDIFAGYIGMQIHGGFLRASPVIELEQIGICRPFQQQGLGPLLMKEAIRRSADLVKVLNLRIESHITFVVWVYEHNENALKVYEKIFTDGRVGKRVQYDDREEVMLRLRVPLAIPVHDQ